MKKVSSIPNIEDRKSQQPPFKKNKSCGFAVCLKKAINKIKDT